MTAQYAAAKVHFRRCASIHARIVIDRFDGHGLDDLLRLNRIELLDDELPERLRSNWTTKNQTDRAEFSSREGHSSLFLPLSPQIAKRGLRASIGP